MKTTVKDLGRTDYETVFAAMRTFTDARNDTTTDELWLTEHHPVFTQGQAGKAEHVLAPGEIPVVQTDRGGQVTFHGPGQIVGYLMFDLRRMGIGVRELVSGIEEAVVAVLADYDIEGAPRSDAPGVYVNGAKVAALGLRVRRGCSYHGLALNVNMDLEPFSRINPCGLLGMEVTQISDLGGPTQIGVVRNLLLDKLSDVYGISLRRLDT
ncbi:MAG: lipoyl(octanoyl) transferase LipB [Gammaproteobacteria bacterium]|nr:lipoyl(octanoyl) transferase LipB [Gammaproteobacteria bacterium]